MMPLYHLIISLITAAILFKFYSYNVIFIIIGGIVIDIDHYFLYAKRKKDFNPLRAYKYFKELDNYFSTNAKKGKKKIRIFDGLLVFHTMEFLLILIIFSFYSIKVFLFTAGVVIHLISDLIHNSIKYNIIKRHSILADKNFRQ